MENKPKDIPRVLEALARLPEEPPVGGTLLSRTEQSGCLADRDRSVPPTGDCVEEDLLWLRLDGTLAPRAAATLDAHAARCERCRKRLDAIREAQRAAASERPWSYERVAEMIARKKAGGAGGLGSVENLVAAVVEVGQAVVRFFAEGFERLRPLPAPAPVAVRTRSLGGREKENEERRTQNAELESRNAKPEWMCEFENIRLIVSLLPKSPPDQIPVGGTLLSRTTQSPVGGTLLSRTDQTPVGGTLLSRTAQSPAMLRVSPAPNAPLPEGELELRQAPDVFMESVALSNLPADLDLSYGRMHLNLITTTRKVKLLEWEISKKETSWNAGGSPVL